jgi:hypothetical protein
MRRRRLQICDAIGQFDHSNFPWLFLDPRKAVSHLFGSSGLSVLQAILLVLRTIQAFGIERHIFPLGESPSDLGERAFTKRENVQGVDSVFAAKPRLVRFRRS